MQHPTWLWIAFAVFIVICLLIDLIVLHSDDHKISVKESLKQTAGWIVLSLLAGVGIYFYMGSHHALNYYTGYLIEYSLSIDNIFVFLLIFNYFKVDDKYQYKVLFWGIFGALVFRFLFILLGSALIEQYYWVVYIFGAFLVYTGYKLAAEGEKEVNPEDNPIIQIAQKLLPVSDEYHESHFFIRHKGKLMVTPLLLVLIMIETTDIVFALDSIPAILSITTDRFIVFSSNAFAILGLRALYFSLAGIMKIFHYLHYALAAILAFVGIKMLISNWYHVPTLWALGFIILAVTVSIVASIKNPKEAETTDIEEPGEPEEQK
ncbi:MAG TPA: TerC family protein [Balneolaceae bacterium]|nr:TerC family protein [Balneolaceae bacterium]